MDASEDAGPGIRNLVSTKRGHPESRHAGDRGSQSGDRARRCTPLRFWHHTHAAQYRHPAHGVCTEARGNRRTSGHQEHSRCQQPVAGHSIERNEAGTKRK